MGFLYDFWFTPEEYELFVFSYGFLAGALILIFSTLIVSSIYYLWLGRVTDSFSRIGKWFLFGIINSILILILCISIIGFRIGEYTQLSAIHIDIWMFSIVNGLIYGFIFYLIVSILMNNFSKYSKYIPFNVFK
ncbi:MAG: hypothetical protein R6W78_08870 [Bacteroidales bacterium]